MTGAASTRGLAGLATALVAALLLVGPGLGRAQAPPAGEATDPERARAQASALADSGNRRRAIQVLEAARERFREDARIHLMLGVLYREGGQRGAAEASLRKATEADPQLAPAWGNLAALHEWQGRYEEALIAATRAVSLAPDDAGYRHDRAIIQYRLGHVEAAAEDGERALELAPGDVRIQTDVGLMLLERRRPGDPMRALELLQRAAAARPEDDELALARAYALLAADRTRAAIEAFDVLLERNPRQAWAAWGRAIAAWRERDPERARDLAKIARTVLPHVFGGGDARRTTGLHLTTADAGAFVRWLAAEAPSPPPRAPDTVTPAQIPTVAPPRRAATGRVRVESLNIEGSCERGAVLERLREAAATAEPCFDGPGSARQIVTLRIERGRVRPSPQDAQARAAPAERCLRDRIAAYRFPAGMKCSARAVFNVLALDAGPRVTPPTLRAEPRGRDRGP